MLVNDKRKYVSPMVDSVYIAKIFCKLNTVRDYYGDYRLLLNGYFLQLTAYLSKVYGLLFSVPSEPETAHRVPSFFTKLNGSNSS